MRGKNILVRPVLKWVGGKRQLLDEITPRIPKSSTYVEPFVGGGAVVFSKQPKKAILNDFNSELINVYQCIKDNPEDLLSLLEEHAEKNTADYFYSIRALDRESGYDALSNVERAARIIYLNKTCYNGLYRVNAAGQFNAPYGKYKHPSIVQEPVIKAVSKYFQENEITLMHGDYAQALTGLEHGAFVYLDPPYMPLSETSAFTGYTQGGFDYGEQVRLKEQCDELISQGIHFLQSNSDCAEIRDLYSDHHFKIKTVKAKRAINSKGNHRGEINEVLISG